MGKRVRYPNGATGFASDKVAEILAKRPGHKILGDAAPAPQKDEKKLDRKALLSEALKMNLGTKVELDKMSDSDLADLVGKDD